MNPIQVRSDGGKQVNILGIPMVIRIQGRDTGGIVSAVESHDVPGGGPPPHIHHREDEMFYIIEGSVMFVQGTHTRMGKPGCLAPFACSGLKNWVSTAGRTTRALPASRP